jgi:putative membrane protein
MTALIVAVVVGIMNVTIRPVLRLLTLPINIITLGLFGLVLNTLLFWSTTLIVPDFRIDGFWWAALGVTVVSVVSAIGNRVVLGGDGEFGRSEE